MITRISFAFLLLFSILFLPFYISAILAILGMFYFSMFVESVILLFISDLLYGVKEVKLFNIYFISFLLSLFFLLFIEGLKKKLKFYEKK